MSKRNICTFLHPHPDSSFSSIPAHLYIPLTTRRQHALTALFFTPSVIHLPLLPPPHPHPPPPLPPPPFCCSYQHKGHLRLYEADIPVSRWCGVMWNVQHLLFAAAMPFHLSHYWISLPPTYPPPPVFIFPSAFQMLPDWICSLPAEVLTLRCRATTAVQQIIQHSAQLKLFCFLQICWQTSRHVATYRLLKLSVRLSPTSIIHLWKVQHQFAARDQRDTEKVVNFVAIPSHKQLNINIRWGKVPTDFPLLL